MTPKDVKWSEVRHHWPVYLFVIPTLILIGLFQYFPAASGIIHSFYRWNGADISEYVGWANYHDMFGSGDFLRSFRIAFIIGIWNVFKMIPPLVVAVCIHRCTSDRMQYLYRCMFVIPMVLPPLIVALLWRSFFFEASQGYLNRFLYSTHLFDLLCYLDKTFQWGSVVDGHYQGIFMQDRLPNWLGHPKLMLISIIIWGFPWVGSFAVLAHLAKLQNISKDVYEAADIDGVNWWNKFTRIEFPLITGSIYLMLVFTIIDTIKDAATVLALADMNGGPGGVVAVPAIFMLRKAFVDNQMGYACSIGIVLTAIIMLLHRFSSLFMNWDESSPAQKMRLKACVFAAAMGMFYLDFLTPLAALFILILIPWAALFDHLRNLLSIGRPARPIDWDARTRGASEKAARRTYSALFLRFSKHMAIWSVLAAAMLPVYLMAIVSMKTNQQFYEKPAMVTFPLHLENWTTAWNVVRPSLANSIYLTVATTFLALLFGLGGAYFFARVRMPLSGFFWNAILVLMMMPTITNLIPLFSLLRDLSLVNTLTALILVGAASGQVVGIFVLRNFIADLPQDLFEAAEIDGASHFQQLRTIVLPLSGTILGTVGIMLFVQQWNEFVLPQIIIRDEIRYPIMVQLQRLGSSYTKEFGPLMAGFAIASIPVILLFMSSMKLFIKGMTEGAVKG